jgi:hypothetical protein
MSPKRLHTHTQQQQTSEAKQQHERPTVAKFSHRRHPTTTAIMCNSPIRSSSSFASSALSQLVGRMAAVLIIAALASPTRARSLDTGDQPVSAVIPSPNQEYGDADELISRDLQRTNTASARATSFPMAMVEPQQQASNEASVPVYVSPFERAERDSATMAALTGSPQANFDRQESSHAPPNYAPRPSASATDLKTSASYGKFAKVFATAP